MFLHPVVSRVESFFRHEMSNGHGSICTHFSRLRYSSSVRFSSSTGSLRNLVPDRLRYTRFVKFPRVCGNESITVYSRSSAFMLEKLSRNPAQNPDHSNTQNFKNIYCMLLNKIKKKTTIISWPKTLSYKAN